MKRIFDCHIHCSERKDDALISYARMNGLRYNLEELLETMEESNVESGLLLSPPLQNGLPAPNQDIITLCEKSRDHLFPIITVEPSRQKVLDAIEIARRNKGYARGFKILLGYFPNYPDDKVYSKIYDYALEHDLPVMFHTGDTASSDGSLEHSHPIHLDALSNRLKDLKIVICHFGNPWFKDTAELLYKHPNVYADISGLFAGGGDYTKQYLEYLSQALSESIYYAGSARKILFGTDYPIEKYEDAISLVNKLKIKQRAVQRILFDNAKQVFKL
ncbi:MAG: amidohydrolase family protein [Nitrososphaerales archaeon]